MKYIKQIFADTDFDKGGYCDFTASAAAAEAGKNWLLCVYNAAGTSLLAIAGQQSLTINRSAESIDVSTKDTEGGWKSTIGGMKEWSIESGGLYVNGDDSHKTLSKAFEDGDLVCVKIWDIKHSQGKFGGTASITDYPIEAPFDDCVTFSITLSGVGPLTDIQSDEYQAAITGGTATDTAPTGYTA